jgi:hypothetical protein
MAVLFMHSPLGVYDLKNLVLGRGFLLETFEQLVRLLNVAFNALLESQIIYFGASAVAMQIRDDTSNNALFCDQLDHFRVAARKETLYDSFGRHVGIGHDNVG